MSDFGQAQREKLIQRIVKGAPKETAFTGVGNFLNKYFKNVPPEDLLERDAESLRAMAIGHAEFAAQRPPGESLIRIFNPTIATHGWYSTHTIIEVVMEDMPFLVDSVRIALNRRSLTVHLTVHPLIRIRRNQQGGLVEFPDELSTDAAVSAESFLHFEIDCVTTASELEAIRSDLAQVLSDVTAAVADWHAMLAKVKIIQEGLEQYRTVLPESDIDETRAFLDWLMDNRFTLLGYREYDLVQEDGEDVLRIVPETGLGILRASPRHQVSSAFSTLPPEMRKHAHDPELLLLTKGNARATVHRPGYIDYIGIKRFGKHGKVMGEHRILGLYASTAYSCDPAEIPVVRHKLQQVANRSALVRNSHAHKALQTILRDYPRDELIQISTDQLFEHAIGILHLQERQRLKLFIRPDPYGRFISCLVFVPRDRYDTNLRERFQHVLMEALHGESVEFTTNLGESALARIHFIVHTDPNDVAEFDLKTLEMELTEAARAWRERLADALRRQYGEERGNHLLRDYSHAFPVGYQDEFSAALAVRDIVHVEKLSDQEDLALNLYRVPGDAPKALRLRLYHSAEPIPLSDVLPILENMGLRVIAERPYEVNPEHKENVWIHDFLLTQRLTGTSDPSAIADRFRDTFVGIWRGDIENDGFNRLVLIAGLDWRQAMTLRAIARYLVQLQVPFSQSYVEDVLADNPAITVNLVRYFEARFDPAGARSAEPVKQLGLEIEEQINAVTSLDEDRILRLYLSVLNAALRTNFYQRAADDNRCPYLVLKLDPRSIDAAPQPRPAFEIFVYAPWVEGVHLRGGKVARGGLRWSDRREDFRTEILGLMKAQMVKNAVIVPVGAKGGFVVKRAVEPDSLKVEVVRCYSTFIQGLLDVTDNLVDGRIQTPHQVVRFDEDDPYLVVAADKGTATFSDIANAIAVKNGFWLGDAFASGGSTGYDHKAMGITARGAWESVKRHFRELGVDCHSTPISVIGIGDMAGDVFGNGMLLARSVKLLAAFNHLHIFVDPDPDPETSFAERERLFRLPRSSWADYDAGLISTGGGVFPRSAKAINLSPEIRAVLDIDATRLTPNELIVAILKAPVDLLWNGGIGTFVKSAGESHAEVGDRVNDPIRVNGSELRCRVVGEGGNLGCTQLGRVEYARAGGLIYTDSIDNSGGVDCSDHEVNIKTLLDRVVAEGALDVPARNALLREMTDEVAALVLSSNYRQTQAISIGANHASERFDAHVRLMRALEKAGKLNRALEFLPDDEQIAERSAEGAGLTRPELAILLSYVKIDAYQRLLDSDAPEDPFLSTDLERYFPVVLSERYRRQMESHPLRREIIATHITNSMVNTGGLTLVHRYCDELGYSISNLVRAYAAARAIFDVPRFRREVEALDNQVAAATQMRMLREAGRLIERASLWLLQNRPLPLSITDAVTRFQDATAQIAQHLLDLVVEPHREGLRARAEELESKGVPEDLARRCVGLGALLSALDIAEVATYAGIALERVAQIYFLIGHRLHLYWLREQLAQMPDNEHWQARAQDGLYWDSYRHQRLITAETIRLDRSEADPAAAIDAWIAENQDQYARVEQVLGELVEAEGRDLAVLTVGVREIQNLIDRTATAA